MDNFDFLDLEDARSELPPQFSPSPGYPPALRNGSSNRWDPMLVLDIAIGVDSIDEILPRYNLSLKQFEALTNIPVFRQELAIAMREMRESGLTFERKSRYQAERYLEVLDQLVNDKATPASVKLECIRSAVKWAKLDLGEKGEGADSSQKNVINVQINF